MKRIIAVLMMLAMLTGCAAVSPSGSETPESSSSAQSSAALSESQAEEPQEEKFSVAPQIALGYGFIIGLDNEGHVVGWGDHLTGQYESVSSWEKIVQIDAGEFHSVGLTQDGHVKISTRRSVLREGISDWENIVQVSAGASHTVGLTADGHAYAAGENEYGECDVSGWEDLVLVEAGYLYTIGLTYTGKVLVAGAFDYELPEAVLNVTSISAGQSHILFLKSDGTVQAIGSNEYGQCDTSDWLNIWKISAGLNHSIGLTYDGKVVAVGKNRNSTIGVNEAEYTIYAVSAFNDDIATLNIQGEVFSGITANFCLLTGGYTLEIPSSETQ